MRKAISSGPGHYRRNLWQTLRSRRSTRWAFQIIYGLIFLAIFGDFMANERPLYCRLDGRTYFPVLHQYAVDLGLANWEARFVQADWAELPYEKVIFAPIPYSARTIDRKNLGARSPFGPQRVSSKRFWHWLGTDNAGHDVLAGLIRGARVALLVGILAMLTATLTGIFLGGLAGFFGDNDFRTSRAHLLLNTAGLLCGAYYAWNLPGWTLQREQAGIVFLTGAVIVIGALALANALANVLKKVRWFRRKVVIPMDFIVMRGVEVLNSIPTLFLLLAIMAVVRTPSILYIMVIIGLVRWTGIARLVRAELLKVRQQDYILAARAMGFSSWRILFRHALPNSLSPVWTTLAFGIAGAILLEAFLSFLGIGLPVEEVTWGSLLRQISGSNTRAWWLAVFPGLAIFITVLAFNLIGERLSDILDPRRKHI